MGKNIKTLRRFLALVMAFGVVAGLCACTQQSSSSAPPRIMYNKLRKLENA